MNKEQIFEDQPFHWGLRGDYHLWNELKERYADSILKPYTQEEFGNFLTDSFQFLTGESVQRGKIIIVERYNHGGMAGGKVCSDFWLDTGFPLLLSRFSLFNL